MSENRLSFFLPTEVGQLYRLKTLVAHSNSLLGPLPTEVGLLSTLEHLMPSKATSSSTHYQLRSDGLRISSLSKNFSTGSIPSTIVSLHQLSALRLADDFFKERIPAGIQEHFGSMEILDVSSNYRVGSIPSQIWSPPKRFSELRPGFRLGFGKLAGVQQVWAQRVKIHRWSCFESHHTSSLQQQLWYQSSFPITDSQDLLLQNCGHLPRLAVFILLTIASLLVRACFLGYWHCPV